MSILVTWLWQGLVVAAAAAVALRCVPRASADTRHAACWATLVAVVCIPIALLAVRSVAAGSPEAVVSYAGGAEAGATDAGAIVLPAVPSWVGMACVLAWMLTTAAGVMRLAHRWRAARHLARRSSPFDASREARLPLWSRARTVARRRAELRVSDDFGGACALGFRRPMIVVGRRLSAALDDEALDLIVLHEQAHLARRDDALQAVQACMLAVAGWHPAVWWLSRRIDLEREAACDDYVLARSPAARQYAAALLHVAAAHGRGSPAVALPATRRPSALRERVGRLFDAGRRRGRPGPLAALVLALPLAVVSGASQFASLVVFVERGAPVMSAAASAPRAKIHVADTSHGRPDARPMEQQRSERVVPTSSRGRGAILRTNPATPRAHGSFGANPQPPLPVVIQPPDGAEDVLPSRRRHAATIGMAARAADPRPSRLLDALVPTTPPPRGPWTSLATSSSGAARVTATAVGDGAKKAGLSLGRVFTRAGKTVAGTF